MRPLITLIRAALTFLSRCRHAVELRYRWKFCWSKAIDIAWSWK